jgi:cytochrome P450
MNKSPAMTMHGKGKPVPVVRGLPLLGNMLDFQRDRLGFLMKAAQYGEVVKYPIANTAFYQINHPEGIKHVLQDNNHNYIKGEMFDAVREVANGLFTQEGQPWLSQRRMMQPIFHRQHVSSFGPLFTETTHHMLNRWQAWAESGKEIDLTSEMTHLTMEIVTKALFGSALVVEQNTISQAITTVLNHISFRYDVPFYPSLKVPTPYNLKARSAIRTIDQIIYRIIQNRQDQPEEPGDLLSLLMQARGEDTGSAMTLSQLRDEVLTFFIAGHETTAVLLSWVWYLLGKHPNVAERLYAEIENVLNGKAPAAEDYPNLTYTRMVLEETLRLYPPAWITNRTVLAEDEICGYTIPAKATVAISPYVIHHHPSFWEEPEKFDPERFSPERSANQAHFAHFPFGGGPRQCIGSGFAMLEACLVLTTMMQHYRFRRAPNQQVVAKPGVTLRPQEGIRVLISRYHANAAL